MESEIHLNYKIEKFALLTLFLEYYYMFFREAVMTNGKKNVLIIDDDDIQILIVRSMLEDDYEILTAQSGKEALEYFRQGHIPNLILLDILMPEMDGWEIFNKIRAISLLEDVPIAFLTSLNGTAEEERARELGAADYIMKPFSKEVLLTRIKNIMEK